MLFQSFVFLFLFLPLVLAFYWGLPWKNARMWVLTIFSYVFYGWWDYRFCGLLILSSLIDYVAGARIARAERQGVRLTWLVCALSSNLSLLGFFKYWDFLAGSVNHVLGLVGAPAAAPLVHIILPLGISFYTFQTMTYSIDIYRRQARPAGSFIKYMAYVSMFPQLVMGPIVRWTEVDDQLDRLPRWPRAGEFALGVNFFVIGLAKKLLVADALFPLVDPRHFPGMTAAQFWPAMCGWSYWLYFDFGSYSDMAVGLGLFIGIRFPINFDSPYRAQSPGEYWARWNMTLGRWMRDYLYFPLGGSRHGFQRQMINILIVFFLIGLWHGANWTMVLWGLYMGVGVVIHNVARRRGLSIKSVALNRLLVFMFVTGAGFFFRAPDLPNTREFFRAAFGANGLGGTPNLWLIALLIAFTIHHHFIPNLWHWNWRYSRLHALLIAALALACVFRMFTEVQFFYFQF
jgi:alginate O-acetyltransferase complex protein AlgI